MDDETATGEQKLNEAAAIVVHTEPGFFPLKVSLLDYFSKATLNYSKRTVLKYKWSVRCQSLWAVCTKSNVPASLNLLAPHGLPLNYDPWTS